MMKLSENIGEAAAHNLREALNAFTSELNQLQERVAALENENAMRTPKPPKEVLVYIDTSGSMSEIKLRRAIARILRLTGGKGRLLLGDAEIYYDGEIDIGYPTNLPIKLGGGTDFRPVFDKIAEGAPPEIFVGFSDLCGPFPENAPDYPVIWCVPKSGYSMNAPWGETIEVDL